MHLSFRPITEAEFPLSRAFKRATAEAAMGDPQAFDIWFPPERPFEALLAKMRAFDPAGCVFTLLDDEIIGHLHLFLIEDNSCGFLNDIYLKPEYRGQGLGDQMDAYACALFRKHGVTRAKLRTNPLATKLMGFYHRLGWVTGDPSHSGWVWMEKSLK